MGRAVGTAASLPKAGVGGGGGRSGAPAPSEPACAGGSSHGQRVRDPVQHLLSVFSPPSKQHRRLRPAAPALEEASPPSRARGRRKLSVLPQTSLLRSRRSVRSRLGRRPRLPQDGGGDLGRAAAGGREGLPSLWLLVAAAPRTLPLASFRARCQQRQLGEALRRRTPCAARVRPGRSIGAQPAGRGAASCSRLQPSCLRWLWARGWHRSLQTSGSQHTSLVTWRPWAGSWPVACEGIGGSVGGCSLRARCRNRLGRMRLSTTGAWSWRHKWLLLAPCRRGSSLGASTAPGEISFPRGCTRAAPIRASQAASAACHTPGAAARGPTPASRSLSLRELRFPEG